MTAPDDGPVMIGMAACLGCKRPFWFDPERVPSIRVDPVTGELPADHPAAQARAVKEPVCPACCRAANPERAAAGLELLPEHDTLQRRLLPPVPWWRGGRRG